MNDINNWQEFRLLKKDKTLVWKIRQLDEIYETQHGQLDGAFQSFSDLPGEKGKVGSKAFVSAVDNCNFHLRREIKKKLEHGYLPFIEGQVIQYQIENWDFSQQLPKNFCSYKPQTSITDKELKKICDNDTARFTRKYDGMMSLLVHHTWGWEIYSRRMDLITARFPNHIKELQFSNFKIGTIIVGEMVCQYDGKDNFKDISRICRSDPTEARKLIEESKECVEPTFFIFDIIFHDNIDLKNQTYDQRSCLWKNYSSYLIKSVDYFQLKIENWKNKAKENGWEGFVVVDGDSIPNDKFYSFDGDAKRPKGHYKLKPLFENDVVIYAGLKGTGKRINGVGSVFIKQLDPETKEWIECGKVGSGFNEEDLIKIEKLLKDNQLLLLQDEKEIKNLDYHNNQGIVITIEYSDRSNDTLKFRFPVFSRIRFDKIPEECLMQNLTIFEE